MRFDFYVDSRKKYRKRMTVPENMHGIDEYVKDWHPRNTQVLQDILTVLTIILMSRIFKKGIFRIWLELRAFLGFTQTPFQKKILYKDNDENTMFYHGEMEREDFVMMMCNHFEQHVLLYGFERYSCLEYKRYFKEWYVPREELRQRGLKGYKTLEKEENCLYSDMYYIRPDYS